MHISTRAAVAALSAAALAGSAATGLEALGDQGGGGHRGATLAATRVAPSVPSDPKIHGAAAGAAPWVIDRGSVRLRRDGRLRVELRGLVIPTAPGNGTPGPVTTVSASLYCGDAATAAGTTAATPISRAGDARIEGRLALPAKCLAPVVLVHPNGNAAAYIAAGGF